MQHDLIIDSFRRYVTISDGEAMVIHSFTSERRFKKGQFISAEGEINRFTNLIKKGSARVYYIDTSGHEHVIQLGINGWWTGDFPSFITQKKGLLYAEALELTTVTCISYDNLQILYEKVPALERVFRLLIQNAYASFQYRVLQSLSMDAEERYMAFKNAYPEMDEQISQKHIASYLGMSAEFLSKIKKRILQKARKKPTAS